LPGYGAGMVFREGALEYESWRLYTVVERFGEDGLPTLEGVRESAVEGDWAPPRVGVEHRLGDRDRRPTVSDSSSSFRPRIVTTL
jgi:hypothetical protein